MYSFDCAHKKLLGHLPVDNFFAYIIIKPLTMELWAQTILFAHMAPKIPRYFWQEQRFALGALGKVLPHTLLLAVQQFIA